MRRKQQIPDFENSFLSVSFAKLKAPLVTGDGSKISHVHPFFRHFPSFLTLQYEEKKCLARKDRQTGVRRCKDLHRYVLYTLVT